MVHFLKSAKEFIANVKIYIRSKKEILRLAYFCHLTENGFIHS